MLTTLALVLPPLAAPPTGSAQVTAPPVTPLAWELRFDDNSPAPVAGSAPSEGLHGGPDVAIQMGALAAQVADFDADGHPDLLLGGGSLPPDEMIVGPINPYPVPNTRVTVHYLRPQSPAPTGTRWKLLEEELDGGGLATRCYDLAAGDFDGDGDVDVVVGRLLEVDTVFLNGGAVAPGEPRFTPEPVVHGDATDAFNTQTFGTRALDVDRDGMLELVTTTASGIRHHEWDRDRRTFVFRAELRDPADPTDPAAVPRYRQPAVGDVNQDGWLDLVVPRGRPSDVTLPITTRARVWYNRREPALAAPFALVEPGSGIEAPPLEPPPTVDVTWTHCTEPPGRWPSPGEPVSLTGTFEAALGDANGDGFPELFAANDLADNCVFLNQGGFLTPDPSWVFASPTPDFVGPSSALDVWFENFDCAAPPDACDRVYTVPGTFLDHTTGVALHDSDGDGVVDLVGFSNRNDWQDVWMLTQWAVPGPSENPIFDFPCYTAENFDQFLCLFGYLGEGGAAPSTFDLVHSNRSLGAPPGTLRFSGRAELLGLPDDGTGYGAFVQLNQSFAPPGGPAVPAPFVTDSAPDWIDANFANLNEGGANLIVWGHPLQARDARHLDGIADPALPVEFALRLALTEDVAVAHGECLAVLLTSASGLLPTAGAEPGNWPLLPELFVPLVDDGLWSTVLGSPGTLAWLTPEGEPELGAPMGVDLGLTLPAWPSAGAPATLYFAALVLDDQLRPRWVSNPLAMPTAVPELPPAVPLAPWAAVEGLADCE